jgi:hypothetical protein
MLPTERQAVADVAAAIRALNARGIPYAGIFAPITEERLAIAMERIDVLCRVDDLGANVQELVTPPAYGRYVMALSRSLDPQRRAFAARHGVGHVVAGHVSEIAFLSSARDWLTHEERVADLFALADIVPSFLLDELRKPRTGWRALRKMVQRIIISHTVRWPEARVFDRAILRIDLYREEHL